MGSAGKTNQNLPKIEFFDHHLKLLPRVQVLPDRDAHVKACPSLCLPISNANLKLRSQTQSVGLNTGRPCAVHAPFLCTVSLCRCPQALPGEAKNLKRYFLIVRFLYTLEPINFIKIYNLMMEFQGKISSKRNFLNIFLVHFHFY